MLASKSTHSFSKIKDVSSKSTWNERFYEIGALSIYTWKYSKFGHFFNVKVIFKSDFLKTLITHDKSTHHKWQINLSFNKIRLISKIGRREPLSFSVWKLLVRVVLKNGAFWASGTVFSPAMNNNTTVNPNDTLRWNFIPCKIIHNCGEFIYRHVHQLSNLRFLY